MIKTEIEYENLRKLNSSFISELIENAKNTIESGWYVLGDNVRNFENEFANYLGQKHFIGLASGLDALILSIKACSFEKNSEIIVPSNTYIATIIAILQAGAKPVLVEPDIKTYNIDPQKIEEKITKNTKAIMVVHLYGKVCDMDPIIDIAANNSLVLIEDCAQAHGATYKGEKAGTFGDLGAFSFYPTKNLGALGDAGGIAVNKVEFSEKLRMLRNYGSIKKYYNEVIGYNSRLDEIQAGFLSVKLKYLDKINKHKRELAKIYDQRLSNKFIKPIVDDNFYDIYHIYNIRYEKRDKLRNYLQENGIKTEIHYPVSPNRQSALSGIIKESFPISEKIHETTLSLPISYMHTVTDIERVVDILNKY